MLSRKVAACDFEEDDDMVCKGTLPSRNKWRWLHHQLRQRKRNIVAIASPNLSGKIRRDPLGRCRRALVEGVARGVRVVR